MNIANFEFLRRFISLNRYQLNFKTYPFCLLKFNRIIQSGYLYSNRIWFPCLQMSLLFLWQVLSFFKFLFQIVFTTSPIIWFAFTLLFSEMRYDLEFIIPLSYDDFNSFLTMLQSKMSQVFKNLHAISAKDILYGWLTSSLF